MKKTNQNLIRIMIKIKLMCLIITLGYTGLNATVWSQEKRINLKSDQVNLVQLFQQMQKKTELKFVFNHEDVQGYTCHSDITGKTVKEILDLVLTDKPLTYEIFNDHVIISPKTATRLPQVKGINITGTVTDQQGEVLPGVSVAIKGTALGVATDADGKFTLTVPDANTILVFSFIGMKPYELKIAKNKTHYNITLENDNQTLEDVVVTGFGTKSRASFTGSAQTVSRDELLSVGTKNILQSLQAFIPGMQLVENNDRGSDPNTRPEILIRGRSSFATGSNVPTFIVDGAEVNLDYIFDMDINDVESATVLKDASASALYGAKAANGVVVITTKATKGGKMRVSYTGTFKASVPDLSDYHLLNAAEKLEYEKRAHLYTYQYGPGAQQYALDQLYNEVFQRIREGVNTDWISKPLRNAFTNNHNVSIYGGDNYVRYNLGVRYGNDRGVMKGSERRRYSLNFKLSYNKDEKIFIQNQTTISSVNNEESPYGSFSEFVQLNPYDRDYNLDGTLNNNLSYGHKNPLYEATLGSYNRGENFYINNTLDMKFEIIEGLRVEGSFALTKYKNDTEIFVSPLSKEFSTSATNEKGRITISNNKQIDYQGKLLLSYNKFFGEGTLMSILAGGNIQSTSINRNGYTGIGIFSDKLAHPGFASQYPSGSSPSGSEDLDHSLGGFLNANIIFKDRYFVDLSIREEGSSKFGSDQRYAPFWSIGGGWNIHKENFFKANPTDRLKLRASVGYLGNASFSPYQALTTYEYKSDLYYEKGIGAIPITIGNPDLKWERTLTYNVGLDVNLFQNRLDVTVDYYKKITDNLLLDVSKAPSIGVTSATENMGKIDNSGIEFRTRVIALRNKNWDWALSLTATHNRNKIKKISNYLKNLNEENNAENSVTPKPVYEEGESISAVKAVQSGGIDPATGQEIYINRQGKPTFKYDYHDKKVYGDSDPKVYGIIGSYLTFRGLSLNLMFDYKLGATIYNQTLVTRVEGANPQNNADHRVFDSRWKEVGDHVKYKDIADTSVPLQTSRFIEDEYTLSLRSLSLAYDFNPKIYSKLHLSRLRIEFLMNDVFRTSSVKQERGFDYPFARSFEFSLSTSF